MHSMFRHDFVQCGCDNEAYVDGGFDYGRVGAADLRRVQVIPHTHEPGGSITARIDMATPLPGLDSVGDPCYDGGNKEADSRA